MVSIENCYETDNFPVFYAAASRNEFLYHVRVYRDSSPFQSMEAGATRMRMLLGFIEARVTVIDAVIKSDKTLQYLSVLCSTTAGPLLFSSIMRKTAPGAVIEEVSEHVAEDYIAHRAVHEHSGTGIPFSSVIRRVHESRNVLLSLLIEYRALVSEFAPVSDHAVTGSRGGINREYAVSFLLFEQGGSVCAMPDFQIEKISSGANGSSILQIGSLYGKRLIICDELLFIKEIDILQCTFSGKSRAGYYRIAVPVTGGTFECNLVVPSFL
jgi:hypothetical protein